MSKRLAFCFFLVASSVSSQEQPFWRPVVMGTEAMVVAEHPLEALAGMKALEAGGNAFDAAVAVFYMTTVVEQHQAGVGGDGFLLAYLAKEDRVVFINGTGPAPARATRAFYEELGEIPDAGPLSTDVPGAVGGFDLALSRYGTMSYAELLAPAIEAAKGHPLDFWAADNHADAVDKISPYESSVALLMPGGRPIAAGEIFRQPDLARSLETIAREGAAAFYEGELARKTAAFYESQGGLLAYDDLAGFEAEEAPPVHTQFRGLDVYESAPNSQGIVLLIALEILEGFDLEALGHGSADYVHLVTESLKLAFADRNQWVGDPRFAETPVSGLLSEAYTAARRGLIRADRALVDTPPGDPRKGEAVLAGHEVRYADGPKPVERAASPEPANGETSSFSIADKFGNLVSVTHSNNARFGSGMVVPGGGYFLNDRMPYFRLEPEDVNVLVPGKRTRHTTNPALVLKDKKPYLAFNTPGGDNQPQAMLQAFLAFAVFGMNVQQAVEAATVTTTAFRGSMYPGRARGKLTIPAFLGERVADALAAKGHEIEVVTLQQPYLQTPSGAGAVKMLFIDPETGVFHGGASPAKSDYVIGR